MFLWSARSAKLLLDSGARVPYRSPHAAMDFQVSGARLRVSPEITDRLQAVASAPDDSSRRAATLALAQWFDERQDPRGEHLHVCQALQTGDQDGVPVDARQRRRLEARAHELDDAARVAWAGNLGIRATSSWRLGMRDGLPYELSMSGEQFLDGWGKVRKTFPTVAGLRLRIDEDDDLVRLAESPAWADVRSLAIDVGGDVGIGWETLVFSPQLTQLRELDLSHAVSGSRRPPAPILQRLAVSPIASRLESLRIVGTGLNESDTRALFHEQSWPCLKELALAGNSIGDQGVREIAWNESLQALERLDLAGCSIESAGADDLAVRLFPKLKELILDHNLIGGFGLRRILQFPGQRGLETLAARSCAFVPGAVGRALEFLGDAPLTLRNLDLSDNCLNGDDALAIARRPQLPELETLDVRTNDLSKDALRLIAGSESLPKLGVLDVRGNRATMSELLELAAEFPQIAFDVQAPDAGQSARLGAGRSTRKR